MITNIFWREYKIFKNSYRVLACVLLSARETGKDARGEFPLGVRTVDTNGKGCLGNVVAGENGVV